MIGIVVDSNSQMPASLAARFGIEVVPLVVSVDGVDHLEGVDLTADEFYAAWADGASPTIATSQPSPGAFVAAYERLIDAGATEILSVHLAESMSGTLNSARLGAAEVSVPVRVVDSGTASFGVSCCAWAAADAIAGGADVETAAAVAARRGAQLGTVFVVGIPELTDRSGRADGVGVQDAASVGIPVLSMSGGVLEVLDTVSTIDAAVKVMERHALGWPPSSPDGGLRIAVGTSDDTSREVSLALLAALDGHAEVAEVVEYTIGPSVGAHTGPGTAGLFVF